MNEPNEIKLSDALLERVAYEIDMFIAIFAKLEAGGLGETQLNNALIEAFCVHARNLNSFFNPDEDKSKPFAEDVIATTFVGGSYVAFLNGMPRNELLTKLQKQITQISLKRLGAENIDDADRRELFLALMAEIQNFSRHLKSNFRPAWKYSAPTHAC